MGKGRDLKVIQSKIKPAFKEEDLDHRPGEEAEGEIGKGPLVRKYIEDLDMEFIAYRSREKRNQETGVTTLRISEDVLSDLSFIIQSGKLPFRDKSQFIRSAIFILMNYYGRKFPHMVRKMKLQDGVELCDFENYQKKMITIYITAFEKIVPELEGKSENEIDRFLRAHLKVLDGIWDEKIKARLVEKFSQILVNNEINPMPYFGEKEEE